MTKIGVLSDSHRERIDAHFQHQCHIAFDDCEVIVHAGDLTDLLVLEPFHDKLVYAVAGNMCNRRTQLQLPLRCEFNLEGTRFGVSHGTGSRENIVDRMYDMFPEADCIIFGHSHQPLCRRIGQKLMVNPGSFRSTGSYGSPGSFAILELHDGRVCGKIYSLPATP